MALQKKKKKEEEGEMLEGENFIWLVGWLVGFN